VNAVTGERKTVAQDLTRRRVLELKVQKVSSGCGVRVVPKSWDGNALI
jgi:hypothetical protein